MEKQYNKPQVFSFDPNNIEDEEVSIKEMPDVCEDSVFLYVIQEDGADGFLKVGYTKDPKKRLKSLSTANPRKLSTLFLAKIPSKEIEKIVHKILSPYHVKNEWFTQESLSVLQNLFLIFDEYQFYSDINKETCPGKSRIYDGQHRATIVGSDIENWPELDRIFIFLEIIKKGILSGKRVKMVFDVYKDAKTEGEIYENGRFCKLLKEAKLEKIDSTEDLHGFDYLIIIDQGDIVDFEIFDY